MTATMDRTSNLRREPLAARLAIGSASPGGVTGSNMLNIAEKPAIANKPRPNMKAIDNHLERERMVGWLNERVAMAQSAPSTEVVTLTPALASLLLEKNDANRPISQTNLDRLIRDISAGRWEFNGEAVVVSKDGKLNDGQHRCRAVVESARSVKVVMVFGTTRESRMTLDTGVARTVGHFLKMNGHYDTNHLGAIASYIWMHREKGRLSRAPEDRPTKAETLLVVDHFKDIPDSLLFVSQKGAGSITSKSMLAFAHWSIMKAAGKYPADEFFQKLIEGTELKKDNPVLYCRNRLIEMRGMGRINDKAELIFRAWNLWRRQERAARIVLTGRLPELEK